MLGSSVLLFKGTAKPAAANATTASITPLILLLFCVPCRILFLPKYVLPKFLPKYVLPKLNRPGVNDPIEQAIGHGKYVGFAVIVR